MKVEFIISTMNKTDIGILSKIFANFENIPDYTVINQCSVETKIPKIKEFINVYEKGLSKSRNRAIKEAAGDILVITDDDTIFLKDADKIIRNAFEENSDADIITFQIQKEDGQSFKKYSEKPYVHNILSLMRVSSIEIAFRKKSLVEAGIVFDERFGLGTEFPTGEEIIFITDAFKKGLKIKYIPVPIVIHPTQHSGAEFDNEKLWIAKGAMFYRIFTGWSWIVILLFAFKKRSNTSFSYLKLIRLMFGGINLIKQGIK